MSRNAEIERSFASDAETWHAVWVHPGWERRVFDALMEAGFSPYLPEQTDVQIRRGRMIERRYALLKGYCFVRLAVWKSNAWGAIFDIDGVGGILGYSSEEKFLPSTIPDGQIDRLIGGSDDYDQIIAWLAKNGKIKRKSQRAVRREKAWDRHIAKRAA